MDRHELPTHLHVEDKLLGGLTVRQVLYLSVGLSVGYGLWGHLTWLARFGGLGVVAHVVFSAVPAACALLVGICHPGGRPLEEWLLVALRYATLPKIAVWRACTPMPALEPEDPTTLSSDAEAAIGISPDDDADEEEGVRE